MPTSLTMFDFQRYQQKKYRVVAARNQGAIIAVRVCSCCNNSVSLGYLMGMRRKLGVGGPPTASCSVYMCCGRGGSTLTPVN